MTNWADLNLEAVEAFVKLNGTYENMFTKTAFSTQLKFYAKNLGITITDEMLQAFSNVVRRKLGLHKIEDTNNFFDTLKLDQETWEEGLETELVRTLLNLKVGNGFFVGDLWKVLKTVPVVRKSLVELVIAKGQNAGIEIKDEELQRLSDSFRRLAKLHNASEFKECLEVLKLSDEDWEKHLESQIYYSRIVEKQMTPFTSKELLERLGNHDVVGTLMNELIYGEFISLKSKELELSVTEKEIQNYLNSFRRVNKLHTSKHFQLWLKFNELNLEQFVAIVRNKLLVQKFTENDHKSLNSEKITKEVRLSKEFLHSTFEYQRNMGAISKAKELNIRIHPVI